MRWILVVGLPVIALLVATSGCSLVGDDGPRVLVIGDSVTQMSAGPIDDALDWAGTVDDRAAYGYRTDQLVPAAEEGVADDPEMAVVVTGYNDLLQQGVEGGAIEPLRDALDEVPCVVWVLLPESGPYPADQARRWNERIEIALDGDPTMHVASGWRALVDGSPDGPYLLEDRLHPTAEGSRALAGVVDGALDAACR